MKINMKKSLIFLAIIVIVGFFSSKHLYSTNAIISNIILTENEIILFSAQSNQQFYLSPNRKLIAITESNHVDTITYIQDIKGNKITPAYPGSFISWFTDSTSVLIFFPFTENGRKIFSLNLNGGYSDTELPSGVIAADFSPGGKELIYSLTGNQTDISTLWIRDEFGRDKILYNGDGQSILAWSRWSPNGDKIAFMKSNINNFSQELWLMDINGENLKEVSNIIWNYPPVWSPDGRKLLFAVQENQDPQYYLYDYKSLESNLWEFDTITNTLNKLTNFSHEKVLQPSYRADGSIIFVSNLSGADEIWSIKDGNLLQLTSDGINKRYPVAP